MVQTDYSILQRVKMNMINSRTKRDCPFCKMIKDKLDHVVVLEDKDILVIMDLYPATPGHLLIFPKIHIETIYEMPPDLGSHIMTTAILMAKTVKEKLSPDGLNLIQANEDAAGQTVPHFHLHIVPRYKGDPVLIKFGHGNVPEKVNELECIASLLKSALNGGKFAL
jgi:histidine triad (HIT) family protein